MRVRFGISTHLYHEQPLVAEHLRELAEFGFRHVELFATLGRFDYHSPAAVDQLAGWLRDAQLELHSVHAPSSNTCGTASGGLPSPPRPRPTPRAGARSPKRWRRCNRSNDSYRYLIVHLGIPDDMKPTADANARVPAQRSLIDIAGGGRAGRRPGGGRGNPQQAVGGPCPGAA